MPTSLCDEGLLNHFFESGLQVLALPTHSPRTMLPYKFRTREECLAFLNGAASVGSRHRKTGYYTLPRAVDGGYAFEIAMPD